MGKARDTERSGDGYIGGIPAHSHQHASDAGPIMPGVRRPPAIVQVNLKPGAEVHGGVSRRDADVPEISGDVTCGNIHRAAKRHCQVLEIPAHAYAFGKYIERGLGRASMLVAERNLRV